MVQQMELVSISQSSNVDILNLVRGSLVGTDYYNRVPEATQANIADILHEMWDYVPNRNQFINQLMNLVGMQVLVTNSYTNSLAKYKRGMMEYGESIEQIAVGLLTAKAYNPDAEYLEKVLFGREPTEVQSRWHKIDRQDMYKLTINQSLLRRAFTGGNGLSGFVEQLMQSISTSDQFDEFEIMLNLFNTYYEEDGFYKVQVPDLSTLSATAEDAKQNLKVLRAWAETLPLKPSREYNAAHMPIVTRPEDLELFITPNAKANMDVEALSAAFNIDKANINSRMTVIPADDIRIPDFQWALTTREFFICADTYLDMVPVQNAAGRYTNYFHHHDGIYSASPFVPALVGVSTPVAPIVVQEFHVDGISAFSVTDLSDDTDVTGSASVARGGTYLVSVAALTYPAGGPNTAVRLSVIGARSTRTKITNYGVLLVAQDDAAQSLTIRATSIDDPTYSADLVLAVTGSLLYGGVGQHVDDNVPVIQNTAAPTISPAGGKVGDTFVVDPGEWDTAGLALTFQWALDGTNVATGGTASSYTPTAAGQLTCAVTASKTGYTAGTATSAAVTVTA